MNLPLISRLLGIIVLLIGAAMALSLPWALPIFGHVDAFDGRAAFGLLGSMAVCAVVGCVLCYLGRSSSKDRLLRKEGMAVVALGWIMASLLGALPFWLSGTSAAWIESEANGETQGQRIAEPMTFSDGVFESASGFSGTGATVLTDVEDKELIRPAILFWRSETHFLGGLGIMVLFVAILGFGSAGKTLMLTEMPGPQQESLHATSRGTARSFATIFLLLVFVLAALLMLEGMSAFDALCHAFATIATGGFSNYNDSVGHFDSAPIDYTLTVFMIIACTNFTLLYYVTIFRPGKLLRDIEFRVYIAILCVAILGVVVFGLFEGDFANLPDALRDGSFQVASIMTNTGFGTVDTNQWCGFNRATLLALMFIGGCAGSTSCSIKVIRHIVLLKSLRNEVDKSFQPRLVRALKVGEQMIEPSGVREVLVYFCLFAVVSGIGWFGLVMVEPDSTWEHSHFQHQKLLDCGSAVAATVNGVGPGFGIVGAKENYHAFHPVSKLILTALMLLGRLELFVLIALFRPRFWRSH